MNFGVTVMIMFLDGIIYGILGWYVKKVFAGKKLFNFSFNLFQIELLNLEKKLNNLGKYGASHPFYFILTAKFWRTTIFCRPFCNSHPSADEYNDDMNYREKKKKNNSKILLADTNTLI